LAIHPHPHQTVRRLEHVLRRLGVGLQANAGVGATDLLVFCHHVVTAHMAQRVEAEAARQR
jgi:hypothetical protein